MAGLPPRLATPLRSRGNAARRGVAASAPLSGRVSGTLRRLACATALALLGGAAAATEVALADRASPTALLPRELTPAPLVDPLAVTPEMRQWLRERVPRAGSQEERLDQLLVALQDPELGLRYDALFTVGAAEVFAARRFNCLSFAHLFVALARELEVDVYYLEVPRADRYRREGDLVLHTGHVTAGWGHASVRRALEMAVAPRVDYQAARRISDDRAVALHHVNLGAEALLRGDHEAALATLATAVTADPGASAAWTNLGVAFRRTGATDAAERAYRQAIAVEAQAVAAYDNLYSLLLARGRRDAARELLDVVTRRAGPNPWLLLSLGDACLRADDLPGARRFYRRARSIARDEAAPAAALAGWALAAGKPADARRWLRRAEKLDPQEPRLATLRQKLPADAG